MGRGENSKEKSLLHGTLRAPRLFLDLTPAANAAPPSPMGRGEIVEKNRFYTARYALHGFFLDLTPAANAAPPLPLGEGEIVEKNRFYTARYALHGFFCPQFSEFYASLFRVPLHTPVAFRVFLHCPNANEQSSGHRTRRDRIDNRSSGVRQTR